MSAQTIIHKSIDSIKLEAEDVIIKNANNHILKKIYALGDGYCSFDVLDAILTWDIINLNNCELAKIINKKIEEVEDVSYKLKYKDSVNYTTEVESTKNNVEESITTLYDLWISKGNSGTIDEFLALILKDNDFSADWDEIKE